MLNDQKFLSLLKILKHQCSQIHWILQNILEYPHQVLIYNLVPSTLSEIHINISILSTLNHHHWIWYVELFYLELFSLFLYILLSSFLIFYFIVNIYLKVISIFSCIFHVWSNVYKHVRILKLFLSISKLLLIFKSSDLSNSSFKKSDLYFSFKYI